MALIVYTYNSTDLNDTTTWSAVIPTASNPKLLSEASPNYISMSSGIAPDYVGKVLQPKRLTLVITYRGASTMTVAHNTLKKLFDTEDITPRTLVLKDNEDSSRQYYTTATCINVSDPNGKNITVELALKSPIYLGVTAVTEAAWNFTVSAATNVVNVNIGDFEVYPVYTITPNVAKVAAGFAYRRYVRTRNYTTKSAANYKIDIAEAGFDTRTAAGAGRNIADSDNSCQLSAGILADTLTIPYDTVTGTLPQTGIGYIGTEQIAWSSKTGTTSGNLVLTSVALRGIGGTTAAAHAENDVLYLSRIMVNCQDVEVVIAENNGTLTHVPRWISPLNSASSRIWISLDYQAAAWGTLKDTISDADTALTLENMVNPTTIPTNSGLFRIDTETLTYTTFNSTTGAATTLSRGERKTTAAAHTAGVNVYWIPDIQIRYGKSDAAAITDPDTEKPMFDLDTSTNTSHVYSNFYSEDYGVGDNWAYSPNIGPTPNQAGNFCFTTEDDWTGATPANPAACLGVACYATQGAAKWKQFFPFGFASIVWTTIDRRWLPAGAGTLRTSTDGTTWADTAIAANNSGAKATTASETTTPASVSYWAMLRLRNSTANRFAHTAGIDISQVTATLSNATTSTEYGVPLVAMTEEEVITYQMDAKLENTTTGEWLTLGASLATGYAIVLDTLNKTVKYSKNNQNLFGAITDFSTKRNQWLRLTLGNNTLKYTEAGLTDITIGVSWSPRKK